MSLSSFIILVLALTVISFAFGFLLAVTVYLAWLVYDFLFGTFGKEYGE